MAAFIFITVRTIKKGSAALLCYESPETPAVGDLFSLSGGSGVSDDRRVLRRRWYVDSEGVPGCTVYVEAPPARQTLRVPRRPRVARIARRASLEVR